MGRLWKDGNWAVAAGIVISITIGALASFSHYRDFADLCAANENGPQCFREWFGAAAGWLAFLAAGITLFALYDQIWEQRKQTEFMVGDANPSVDVMAEEFTYAYIQIVNWNRRTFLVDSILPADDHSLFASLEEIEIDEVKYAIPNDWEGRFKWAQHVPGWIDRVSKAPILARFKVRVFFTNGSNRMPRRETITIEVAGRLVGEEHKTLTLPAKAMIHSY